MVGRIRCSRPRGSPLGLAPFSSLTFEQSLRVLLHVQKLETVPLGALTPAMLEDTIADAARVAPRQAQLALGTVKQVLRDAMKRGQRVDPALLEVKAPGYEEREPILSQRD